eukprot:975298-Karenia_brevis.AAC.1
MAPQKTPGLSKFLTLSSCQIEAGSSPERVLAKSSGCSSNRIKALLDFKASSSPEKALSMMRLA